MKKNLFLIITLFLISTNTHLSMAQTNTEENKFATAEEIAIGFYKTGNILPNFKNWITAQPPYNKTSLGRRPQIMEKELIRLNTAYQNFNPEHDLLSIKTSAFITPNITETAEGTKSYSVTIDLDKNEDEIFYLPYFFLEQNIMVIPYKLESLKSIEISAYTYDHIKKITKTGEKYPFILNLRPAKVDMEQPHLVDGYEQWAFYTDIISLESWTEDHRLIWEYTTPGYLSPQQQEIKDLYNIKPINDNLSKGAVKVFTE